MEEAALRTPLDERASAESAAPFDAARPPSLPGLDTDREAGFLGLRAPSALAARFPAAEDTVAEATRRAREGPEPTEAAGAFLAREGCNVVPLEVFGPVDPDVVLLLLRLRVSDSLAGDPVRLKEERIGDGGRSDDVWG